MKDIMKARKKDTAVKPPAHLDQRVGDYDLPPILYLKCQLFDKLKSKPNPDKFPGTLVLRYYRAGEVICQQGDPGWTAFAILTGGDLEAMAKERDKLVGELPAKIEKHRTAGKQEELERDEALLERLRQAVLPSPEPPRSSAAAAVYLDSSATVARSTSWLGGLFGRRKPKPTTRFQKFVSVDASTTVDLGTRKASMEEGSLFGEWSCIYGTPRSATIIAERPCYVLEMLRNVLDSIMRDAQFQKDSDAAYVKSVLSNHLAGLSFFRELKPQQLEKLKEGVKLRRCKDGEVIFKRGDESTAMYIVRRGLVKVLVHDPTGEAVLTYLAQGDHFGEMGVMLRGQRSATCVAYVHPVPEEAELDPQGDRWRKDEERVELVEIPAGLFRDLVASDATLAKRIDAEIDNYLKKDRNRKNATGMSDGKPYQSSEFQKLGLIQGQKLMLVDLDRCTRCDECVQACVATHEDGRTRLFLDGPRFGKYLVPTTCRSCRDPVCLIGCPVGSIRRGDNLQIVIEDWCIGCQLCSRNCPYGSIQMHDLGLIAEETHGWRFSYNEWGEKTAWTRPGFNDRNWQVGATPFYWDKDMKGHLPNPTVDPVFCFRYSFAIPTDTLGRADSAFKLSLASQAREVSVTGTGRSAKVTDIVNVWVNGMALGVERWSVASEQFVWEISGDDRKKYLHAGQNVIAVKATGVEGKRVLLLQLALDEVRPSGAVIPLTAVVCDQCSTLPDQTPSCVHACPHDAAMRVDAWTAFPGGKE